MKRFVKILLGICMAVVWSIPVSAATTSPGDIASVEFTTLSAAHNYYVNTLGQSCRQCGIPAKWWARPGDYGFGIYAHGTMYDAFWIMMSDTHWLVVNGYGSTGDWVYGNSKLASKYKQTYESYKSGAHPWSGLESFPTKVIHGETLGNIGSSTYSNLCNVSEFYWGGNNCTEIGDHAFYDMNSLGSIKIDDNIVRIKDHAFGINPILSNVSFGSSLQRIGRGAFKNTPIKECKFPAGLKSIEQSAFSGCSKMRNVFWGKARCKVGKYAFNNCYNLGYKTIKYLPKYIEADSSSFRNCYGVDT